MTPEQPEDLNVSLDDLQQHIVGYGVDVRPRLDAGSEVKRTHNLFQCLQERWPPLFQELSFRPKSNELKVLATFTLDAGEFKFPTLTITGRGPVFKFPLRIPGATGDILDESTVEDVFIEALEQIRTTFPGTTALRVGLVRELLFSTGKSNSAPYLTSRFGPISGASPTGGGAQISFQDNRCNIRVEIDTVRIERETRSTIGTKLEQQSDFGLRVKFDVNNIHVVDQSASEIATTLERAHSLWPKELLGFLNWRRAT